MTKTFILFHLNLAYSSIAESARADVIKRCYYPLLALAKKTQIPIGIELTAWTLRQIQLLDPDFITAFKKMLSLGQCELIGSGYTQMIGPLVPYEVNVWNQTLGMEDYQAILGVKPRLALINEMAFSTGLVEVYQKAGYEGIIMDRDNIRLALGLENQGYEAVPSHALGLNDSSIPVLWSDSLLFQKLQRFAHGDSRLEDYLSFFKKRVTQAKRPIAVYCNDVEIFDYRPGRFKEERPAHHEGEWNRLERLLTVISAQDNVTWLSPSQALAASLEAVATSKEILTSISQPIPVKKQAKYNVSRWAITGRNDLWINTLCYRIAQALQGSNNPSHWRRLCELWASDIRTHIEKNRWRNACEGVRDFTQELNVSCDYGSKGVPSLDQAPVIAEQRQGPFHISQDSEAILLTIKSTHIELVLNLRRGLAIHSLAFSSLDFAPLVGTLAQGYFESIEYGADFYTGGVVMEFPIEHRRLTDLERVLPTIQFNNNQLKISASIVTEKGVIIKSYILPMDKENIIYGVKFPDWQREHSIVRVAALTILPEAFAFPLYLETINGGVSMERFSMNKSCDHTLSASGLVSCTTGFGATTGEIIIGDQQKKLQLRWDPTQCALFPIISHRLFEKKSLTRVFFSLNELDETMHAGGEFPDLEFMMAPVC